MQAKFAYYCEEMSTLWRCSLGRWPAPVDVHERLAVLQLEQGQSLSHRIYGAMLARSRRRAVESVLPCEGGTGRTKVGDIILAQMFSNHDFTRLQSGAAGIHGIVQGHHGPQPRACHPYCSAGRRVFGDRGQMVNRLWR